MSEIQNRSRILSVFSAGAKKGVRVWDVFDIIYETNLPYPALKEELDCLAQSGEVVCRDEKTYEYTGAAERDDVKAPPEKRATVGKDGDRRDAFQRYLDSLDNSGGLFADDDDDDIDDDGEDNDGEEDIYGAGSIERCAEAGREYLDKNGIEFGDKLQAVLSLAITAAEKFGSAHIGTEHIVYAMLLTDCPAKTALGFTAENVIEYTAGFLSELCNFKKSDGFSEQAKSIISEAVQYAKELGGEDALAGTPHMLFKILAHPECVAVKIINGMKIRLVEIYKRLAKAINS